MVPHCCARSGVGSRCSKLALGAVDYREDGFARNYHRMHACVRARGRRNGAADFYGVWQFELERGTEPADLRIAA